MEIRQLVINPRMMRSSMLEVALEGFVMVARAKGLAEKDVTAGTSFPTR